VEQAIFLELGKEKRMDHKVVNDYTQGPVRENDGVKVFVRARSATDGEEVPKEMWSLDKNSAGRLAIVDPERREREHAFQFHKVLWTKTSQEVVFKEVAKPLVDHCFKGFNGCCFAYGETGSGKTYTMFGGENTSQRGLIPRCVDYIFARASKSKGKSANGSAIEVSVSLLELYCDEIRDLGKAYLRDDSDASLPRMQMSTAEWYMHKLKNKQSFASSPPPDRLSEDGLKINEDHEGNVFVKNLCEIPVTSAEQVLEVMQKGFELRATHETKSNKYSSRSHTVFTIRITQTNHAEGKTTCGVLNLVDLAGSERLRKSEAAGQRMREALAINSSLSALGKVVASLDPSKPLAYVPYRDSKLTRLLQDSLGGNSHTSVIATLHPTRIHYEECLCTLQFANRCRFVVNQPRVNYIGEESRTSVMQEKVKRLQGQVRTLKCVLAIVTAKKNHQIGAIVRDLGIRDATVLKDGRVQLSDGSTVGNGVDAETIEKQVNLAIAAKEKELDLAKRTSPPSSPSFAFGSGATSILVQEDHEQKDMGLLNFASQQGAESSTDKFSDLLLSFGTPEALFVMDDESSIFPAAGSPTSRFSGQEQFKAKFISERDERHAVQKKLESKEEEMSKLREEFEAKNLELSSTIKELRASIQDLKKRIAEVNLRAMNKETQMRREFDMQLDSLKRNSETLETNAQRALSKIPVSLRVDSHQILQANEKIRNISRTLGHEHQLEIEELLEANAVQQANIKQQAEFWIMKKDLECRQMVKDFNKYHKTRKEEAAAFESELKLSYKLCNKQLKMFRIFDKAEELEELNVSSIKNKSEQEKRVKVLRKQSEVMKKILENLCEETKIDAPECLKNVVYEGVHLGQVPVERGSSTRKLLRALFSYIESLHSRISNQGHDLPPANIMDYVKTLEEGLESYKVSFKEEAQRHRNLQIAHASLQRQQQKARKKFR